MRAWERRFWNVLRGSSKLDTGRLPPNMKRTGPNTFDTLTGNAIQMRAARGRTSRFGA
jgi:hypothetical protein